MFLVSFTTLFLLIERNRISHTPDKLPFYNSLFSEVKNKDERATYYFIMFLVRRIIFAF
jgi:hypothetical protein